jgi:hypothetical protein
MPGIDDLSEAEQAALDSFMTTDQTVPIADEQEGAPADPTPASSPKPDPTPTPAPAPAPAPDAPADPAAAPAPAAPEQTNEERFAAWREQHKDKTPEQLAELAFQQSQRANGAEARARTASQNLQQINERVEATRTAAAAARAKIQERREQFDQQLRDDPDAAARVLRDESDAAALREIDAAEHAARVEAAIGLATQALPDFQERAPAVMAFGGEMGYSRAELEGISDGRDLVVLSLADMAARLIKGGMMDMKGNLLAAAPQAVADAPTDPRLTAPTPHQSLSSAPARPANSSKTAAQQADDILGMSDADFDKLPPAELDALLRQLAG